MDTRNWFELVVRRSEVAELTPQQRESLAEDLRFLEDKLVKILSRYGIEN